MSYVDWLRVEAAEAELAGALGRGERVKIGDREAIEALCRALRGLTRAALRGVTGWPAREWRWPSAAIAAALRGSGPCHGALRVNDALLNWANTAP